MIRAFRFEGMPGIVFGPGEFRRVDRMSLRASAASRSRVRRGSALPPRQRIRDGGATRNPERRER